LEREEKMSLLKKRYARTSEEARELCIKALQIGEEIYSEPETKGREGGIELISRSLPSQAAGSSEIGGEDERPQETS